MSLWLASSNAFSRLWCIGAVPKSLMTGPGVVSGPECESPIKEVGVRALNWLVHI